MLQNENERYKRQYNHMPAHHIGKQTHHQSRGLVNIPNTSIKGMIGNGNFNHNGTSGQNISFQYSFVPRTFTTINVHKARTIVTAILPVKLAATGENYDQP